MSDFVVIHRQLLQEKASLLEAQAYAWEANLGAYQLWLKANSPYPHGLFWAEDEEAGALLCLGRDTLRLQAQAPSLLSLLSEPQAWSRIYDDCGRHHSGLFYDRAGEHLVIFRDKMGLIPLLWQEREGYFLALTSDPHLQAALLPELRYRESWLGRYLLGLDDESREDVYEGSLRLCAGEALVVALGDVETEGWAPFCALRYWSLSWAAELLREIEGETIYDEVRVIQAFRARHAAAVAALPRERRLAFSISGGLDAASIVSVYARQNPEQPVRAFSLYSQAYPESDESSALDSLEAALPIRLTRICMDGALALSEPEANCPFGAYGPLLSPGIERSLCLNRAVKAALPQAYLVMGYGGNLLVKVRPESVLRSCLQRCFKAKGHSRLAACRAFCEELCHLAKGRWRTPLARAFRHLARGRSYRWLTQYGPARFRGQGRRPWIKADFAARYRAEGGDPYYAMTHLEERDSLPRSWSWELSMRALDAAARLTQQPWVDPLLDPELYAYSSLIPPRFFLKNGNYRALYREALRELLPADIVDRAKSVSFDRVVDEGLYVHGSKLIEAKIEAASAERVWADIFDFFELKAAYARCRQAYACGEALPVSAEALWRSLSLLL